MGAPDAVCGDHDCGRICLHAGPESAPDSDHCGDGHLYGVRHQDHLLQERILFRETADGRGESDGGTGADRDLGAEALP